MRSRALKFILPLFMLCLVGLLWSASGAAEDSAPVFELSPARGAVDMPEPSAFGLDTALGAVGLPGLSGAPEDQSTYEKAWQMSDGPNGGTRLTYGERYRRNPDGSYGAQSSSQWRGTSNIGDRLLEQALSAGSGYFSSWAEGWLGGYGKARLSVRVNDEGDVTGSGDFLYPFYDSERTTFFTQLGLRTMANDRVIGNFGLGQRFFPSENTALGYNVFLDQDFSRNHTRGGAGLEAWYDWLRLSANYYTPLSGWKNSKDYDHRLVEERPAEGYDARLTGYLPFYRNLAVTGAFEKWKGDHVGSFGSDDVVQKDPKVWSYGLEWTPVPAFSASANQRHSGGRKETQFGLTFNYHFGMDWGEQLTPAVVTEMRTVGGSRHDFVDRQNEMILEYRVKDGAFQIVLLRVAGTNLFVFRITDGFGQPVAGQTVRVSADQGARVASGGVFVTDENGLILMELEFVPTSVSRPLLVTLNAGKTTKTIALTDGVAPTDVYTLEANPPSLVWNVSAPVVFTVKKNGQTLTVPITVNFDPSNNTNYSGLAPLDQTTDAAGNLPAMTLTAVNTSGGNVPVTAVIEGQAVNCDLSVSAVYVVTVTNGPNITAPGFSNNQSVVSIEVSVTKNGVAAPDGTQVLFSPDKVTDSVSAMNGSRKNLGYGFQWTGASGWAAGANSSTMPLAAGSFPVSDGSGQLAGYLTDIIGQRNINLELCVTEDSGVTCATHTNTATATVSFGNGPLAKFPDMPLASSAQWSDNDSLVLATSFPAATACGGGTSVNKTNFPAQNAGSGNDNWSGPSFDLDMWQYFYAVGSKLPFASDLLAVAAYDNAANPTGKGAALAAGWPAGGTSYWTGEVMNSGTNSGRRARLIQFDNDGTSENIRRALNEPHTVVCQP